MQNDKNEKKYKIGEFAQKLRVNMQTLRLYDKAGILCPKRSEGGQRWYTDEDFGSAKTILYLTHGLLINLNGVKIILNFLKKRRLTPTLGLELLKDMAKTAGISDEEISNNIKRYNKDVSDVLELWKHLLCFDMQGLKCWF